MIANENTDQSFLSLDYSLYYKIGVQEHGFYEGYEYAICVNNHNPCCYIFLKKGDPYWEYTNYDSINIPIHGGVTYLSSMLSFQKRHNLTPMIARTESVMGWDYAHLGDYSLFLQGNDSYTMVWTLEDLREEVKKAIKFLLKYNKWKGIYG